MIDCKKYKIDSKRINEIEKSKKVEFYPDNKAKVIIKISRTTFTFILDLDYFKEQLIIEGDILTENIDNDDLVNLYIYKNLK